MFSSLFLLLSSPFSFVVALVVVLVIVVVEFLLILFLLPLSNKNEQVLLLLLLLLLFPYDVDAVNEESARMMLEAMVDASRRARERKTQSEEGKKMRDLRCSKRKNQTEAKKRICTFSSAFAPVYSESTVVTTRVTTMEFKTTTLKYGLNPAAKGGASKKNKTKKPPALSLFENESDDEEDEDENNTNGVSEAERAKKRHNEEIKRQQEAAKAKGDAEAKEIYEQALKEDPNIFAYDDALTDIEKGREATLREEHGEKIERKSRYIAQLKEAADFRKREQDITYERRLMKEREKEDELYGEKEKFITSAYRKKLEEDEKWKKEELERERREKEREVDGKSDMTSFYANLMNRNVATGGDTATHSRKAPEPKAADSSLVVSQIEKNKEKEIERTITKEKFPKSGIFSDDKKETPMSAIERKVDDKKQLEDQSEDELRKKTNVGEIAVKKSATIDREEKAKSARERYLARKRKEPS